MRQHLRNPILDLKGLNKVRKVPQVVCESTCFLFSHLVLKLSWFGWVKLQLVRPQNECYLG